MRRVLLVPPSKRAPAALDAATKVRWVILSLAVPYKPLDGMAYAGVLAGSEPYTSGMVILERLFTASLLLNQAVAILRVLLVSLFSSNR